ncbi:MAG: hypothetical protein B7Z81_06495 [Acidocella sp. 20-61-6]|nr:MAG: hypothetical protein B7Z81_06495 [Acidocella sp. 20-61-6]
MDIEFDYSASVAQAPSGFTAALQYAAGQFDALITNNITVSIAVSWDNAVFGEGGPTVLDYGYGQVAAALAGSANTPAAIEAAGNLPAQDPNPSGLIALSVAQAEALNLSGPSLAGLNAGAVIFGADGTTLNFSTTDPAIPGEYDFLGIAEHELAHALGRFTSNAGPANYILDLYRYAAPGMRSTNGYQPSYFSIDGGVTPLATFSTSSDLSDWAASATNDSFGAYASPGVATTLSSADLTLLSAIGFQVACFTPGTRIATPSGAIPIERLAIGDPVLTRFRGVQNIRWIGTRRYDGRFIGANHLVLPVTIRAGALAPGIPARDLTVSPGHGICLDGALVPAWRLINGASITQAEAVESVEYFHIELARHDLIFAETCPAESFLDETFRAQFQNAAQYQALYPEGAPPQPSCLPRVEDGFLLQTLQRQIDQRAGLPRTEEVRGKLRGFIDIAGPDRVAGWAQNVAQPEIPVRLTLLASGQPAAQLLANRYRADLRDAGIGNGCHAFELAIPPGLAGPFTLRRSLDGTELPLTTDALAAAA